MELHSGTGREEVPVNEQDECTTAEVVSDAASKSKSESSQATSTPSDNAQPCVLDLEAQCFVCYDIAKSNCRSPGGTPPLSGCPHSVRIPLPALRHSAQESDCQICHVFWGALTPFIESADEDAMTRAFLEVRESDWRIWVYLPDIASEPKSRITSCNEYYKESWVYLAHLFVPSGDSQRWFSMNLPRSNLTQKHTDSAASYAIMRAWLSECLQNHENCKDPVNNFITSVPNRLVHIVSKSCARLSTRHSPQTPYLALSYCWGVTDMFSTTSENLKEHLEGISVSKLPKTFRHALVITQALGYEYIWIDSLCILQGDKEDFAHQSGQMSDIYSNADLVLSADLAKSVHEGFLHERTRTPFAIEIPMSKYTQHQYCQQRNEPHAISSEEFSHRERHTADNIKKIFVYPIKSSNVSPRTSPTFERAWCFQEQRLARRLIHFTEDSMYWKCSAQIKCECGVTHNNALDLDHKHNHGVQDPLSRRPLTNYTNTDKISSMVLDQLTEHWSDVVREYSGRKLTNPTDRLPGIAGFASRLQTSALGEYHAGLWENSLPCALLWFTIGGGVVMPEARAYIGPTWSWVTSTRGVREPHYHDELTESAKVLQVRTYLESSETYGPVRASWIRLSGLLRRVSIMRRLGPPWGFIPFDGELSDIKVHQKGARVLRARVSWDSTQHEFARPVLHALPEWHLLVIAKDKHSFPEGLVLIKSRKQPGAFERVGRFVIDQRIGHGWKRKVVTII